MNYNLVRYYDTCCDKCGNWASGDINPSEMRGNKSIAEKALKNQGWKAIKGETICNYCVKGIRR